jgi:hypothetical protein
LPPGATQIIRDSIKLTVVALRPAPARLARLHVPPELGGHMAEECLRAGRVPGVAVGFITSS